MRVSASRKAYMRAYMGKLRESIRKHENLYKDSKAAGRRTTRIWRYYKEIDRKRYLILISCELAMSLEEITAYSSLNIPEEDEGGNEFHAVVLCFQYAFQQAFGPDGQLLNKGPLCIDLWLTSASCTEPELDPSAWSLKFFYFIKQREVGLFAIDWIIALDRKDPKWRILRKALGVGKKWEWAGIDDKSPNQRGPNLRFTYWKPLSLRHVYEQVKRALYL